MAQISVPQLSEFQLGVLTDTALSSVPIFLLPRPTFKDSSGQKKMLVQQYEEIKSLLSMGLIEDVSNEFRKHIADHSRRTGRTFKVFGLSELGFCMFNAGVPQSVN